MALENVVQRRGFAPSSGHPFNSTLDLISQGGYFGRPSGEAWLLTQRRRGCAYRHGTSSTSRRAQSTIRGEELVRRLVSDLSAEHRNHETRTNSEDPGPVGELREAVSG